MNKALLILTLTTLGGGSAAAYFHSQLAAERQRSEALQTRIATLEQPPLRNPFVPAPVEPPTARWEIGRTPPVTTAAIRPDPPAAMSPERPVQMRQRFVDRQRELLRDPEYRQAMRTQHRFGLQQAHPDLARELNISQEQADRLLDLLVEQQLRNMENLAPFSADKQPTQAEIAQMQKAMQQRQRDDLKEIGALLGNNGMQQWQDYQNSMGARMRVRQLASELDGAGLPLRGDQRAPLRDALAQFERQTTEERRLEATSRDFNTMTPAERLTWQEEQIERSAQSYERARDAVSHILTPEQLRTYRELQERDLVMRRAGLRMQRAQLEAAGDAAAGNTAIPGVYSFSSGSIATNGQVVIVE